MKSIKAWVRGLFRKPIPYRKAIWEALKTFRAVDMVNPANLNSQIRDNYTRLKTHAKPAPSIGQPVKKV